MNLNLRHFLGYIKQFVSAWDSLGIPSWWMQFQHPPTGYRFSRAVAVGPNYWSFGGGFRVSVANTRAKLEWVKRGQARIGAVGILDGRRAKGKEGRELKKLKAWPMGVFPPSILPLRSPFVHLFPPFQIFEISKLEKLWRVNYLPRTCNASCIIVHCL